MIPKQTPICVETPETKSYTFGVPERIVNGGCKKLELSEKLSENQFDQPLRELNSEIDNVNLRFNNSLHNSLKYLNFNDVFGVPAYLRQYNFIQQGNLFFQYFLY